MDWLAQNAGTVIVCVLLAGAVALAIISIIKNKRQGKSSCGSCAGCAYAASCNKKQHKKQ